MVSLKSILVEANSLSPTERAELIAKFLEQIALEERADDAGVTQRGLAAWTEFTQGETWEEYYPENLRVPPGADS
jgi:hypothetical protein